MLKGRMFLIVVLGLVLAGVSQPAFADSYTDPTTDITFTGTVTSGLVTLTVQCGNAALCGSIYLGDVVLKGFSWTGTPALGSAPGGYTLAPGGMNLGAIASGGGCDGSDTGGALCWDNPTPTALSLQLGTSPLVFTATITGGSFSTGDPLHVQAAGFNTTAGTQQRGNKPLAVSCDLAANGTTTCEGNTSVPEPGTSTLLFAGGLLGLALLARKAALA